MMSIGGLAVPAMMLQVLSLSSLSESVQLAAVKTSVLVAAHCASGESRDSIFSLVDRAFSPNFGVNLLCSIFLFYFYVIFASHIAGCHL
jgi:hypothetical protein